MATKAEKTKRQKERKELNTAEREAKLKAFKSIDNPWEMISYVLTYSRATVAFLLSFITGFVVGKYDLIMLILKKVGLVSGAIK